MRASILFPVQLTQHVSPAQLTWHVHRAETAPTLGVEEGEEEEEKEETGVPRSGSHSHTYTPPSLGSANAQDFRPQQGP